MDVSQYLEIFLDETNEHLQNLNTQILELESDPENMDNINEIFRAAHSLKGMAGTMGYKRMQNLTHDMENVFSEVQRKKKQQHPQRRAPEQVRKNGMALRLMTARSA